MTVSDWKIDPVTDDLLAPGGKRIRNISEVDGTDAASVNYVNAAVAGAPGENNTAMNVGGGAGVYRDKTGVQFNFRTLIAGAGVAVVQNADTIEVSAVPKFEEMFVANNPGNTNAGPLNISDHDFAVAAGDYWIDATVIFECAKKAKKYNVDIRIDGVSAGNIIAEPGEDTDQRCFTLPTQVNGKAAGNLNVALWITGDGGANVISVIRFTAKVRGK